VCCGVFERRTFVIFLDFSLGSKRAPMAEQAAQLWKPRHNQYAIALTVTLATFMEVLDTSIANVALPHIAGGLGASQDEATWVLTSYLVANAVVLPASAYLVTFFGRKKFYMACVMMFGLSSMLCGLAPSLPLLILFRVLQGVGGGGLQPSEQAILADTFAPEKRGQAFAIYGMAVVAAPALGPTLGGWITDNFDWRWIFFINVPIAILSLILTNRLVEDPPFIQKAVAKTRKTGLKLDFFGFGLLALGFGSLEFVLDKGQEADWFGSRLIVFFTVMCVVSLGTLVVWSIAQLRKGGRPILNLELLLKNRNFAVSFMMMFLLGFALFATTVLIPQYLQSLMGYTAELAGLVISPGGLTIMVMMPLVGFLIQRIDPRYLVAFGFTVTTIALLHMRTLNPEVSYGYAASLRIYQTLGLAFLFVPINTMAYTGIKQGQSNDVSGLTNLARNIGGSVGTAVFVTMLARREQFHQDRLGGAIVGSNPMFQQRVNALKTMFQHAGGLTSSPDTASVLAYGNIYRQLQRQATELAYVDVIQLLAIACACMLPLVFLLKKRQAAGAPMGH